MELVIATTNRHKLREMKHFLSKLDVELLYLSDFPDYIEPEETGETFEENAILKATHAASFLGKWVIADDSGLVIPALDGLPGVRSKRFASEHATDLENRILLLEKMSHLEGRLRDAHFVCSFAVANQHGLQKQVSASCYGAIATEERGSNGFGYDSVFIKDSYNNSFAELSEEIKQQVSHRAKAYQKLTPYLESLIEKEKQLLKV